MTVRQTDALWEDSLMDGKDTKEGCLDSGILAGVTITLMAKLL